MEKETSGGRRRRAKPLSRYGGRQGRQSIEVKEIERGPREKKKIERERERKVGWKVGREVREITKGIVVQPM